MKKLILLMVISGAITACDESNQCNYKIHKDDARPDILIIGDSISIGYTPTLIDQLGDEYDIIHNPCNAENSTNGTRKIDEWLALRENWYAITFNHGAWDVSKGSGVSGKRYEKNIDYIANKINEATPRPLFIYTAHVPINDATRFPGSEIAYNAIAESVMAKYDIPTSDVYTPSLTFTHLHLRPLEQDDVHWQEAGSKLLGQQILNDLNLYYGVN